MKCKVTLVVKRIRTGRAQELETRKKKSVASGQQAARKAIIAEKETFGLENGAKIHHIPGPKKMYRRSFNIYV